MNQLKPQVHDAARAQVTPSDPLRGALLDSRQRWRDLVAMAADLAFETDAGGRFSFIFPDPALGWPAGTLLGQPADLLLADASCAAGFSPFRLAEPIRRRRSWLKRADGTAACMTFAAAPLLDSRGAVIGARGVAVDMTEQDGHEAQVAAALRRGEVLDHILWRMRQEVLAPRMMRATLDSLINAMGAEGACVLDLLDDRGLVLHEGGGGASAVLPVAVALLREGGDAPTGAAAPDGRPVLVCPCQTRFGEQTGLALWRLPGSRPWDTEDELLASSAGGIIRVVLEHESIQREMARQARTDPLTGLLNRRAFIDEVTRHIDRLDREDLPGTLVFGDLDNFKPLNDRLGHDAGDEALCAVATLLRAAVRPSDLVARLGGDEFALWLNGADALTAAERADMLCATTPRELAPLAGDTGLVFSLSLGVATRAPGTAEDVDSLLRRADLAMYEVKRSGRGHWRVSQAAPD